MLFIFLQIFHPMSDNRTFRSYFSIKPDYKLNPSVISGTEITFILLSGLNKGLFDYKLNPSVISGTEITFNLLSGLNKSLFSKHFQKVVLC